MSKYLFVYGTLHHSMHNKMSDFLQKNSTFIGNGVIKAKMFDVGKYPAVILSEFHNVFGSVYQPKNEFIISILDDYEGFNEENLTKSLYIRTAIEVEMENQSKLNCYVYLYNQATEGLLEITSGNYITYVKSKRKLG